MKRGLRFFFYGIFILLMIFCINFTSAMTNVTNFHFELGNTTVNYDNNGAFFINWTNATGFNDNHTHNLYITFSNNTIFQIILNTINRSFNSAVNANFTFKVEAVNGSNSADRTNFSIRWMVVDTLVPNISYNSNTETNNSAANRNFIFVNVSASDTNTVSSNLTFELYNGTSGVRLRQNRTAYNSATANNTFNWTSVAEGKYYFNVTANDSATNSNLTDTRTFFLDSTKPTISLQSYSNATIERNTDSLTLNIFVNDSLSGLTGASCLVDVNGTNQTIALSSGWCNGTVALTGLSDGNQTIKVYANDTANNFGLNNSFVVFMDSANPTATASCSSTTIYEGDTFPCTCSGTDALTSVTTSESSTGSLTNTFVAGSFTYTCSVTDIAGNTASEAKNYIVLSRGGGGSVGTTPKPPEEIHSWTKMTPGVVSIMQDFDSEIGVKQIQITVNNEAQNVQIIVTKYDGKPAEVSVSKSGKVYQYLQIDARGLENNLDKATVQFRVEKSWISSNGLGKDEISVYKYGAKWNALKTTYASEDSQYNYYDVELDSFSFFAIAEGDTIVQETADSNITVENRKNTFLWILIALGLIIVTWWVRKQPNP